MPDAGTYRGEAARTWLNAWVQSFDSLTLEANEFIETGDKVMVEFGSGALQEAAARLSNFGRGR